MFKLISNNKRPLRGLQIVNQAFYNVRSYSTLEPAEHAPGQEENEAWLNSLQNSYDTEQHLFKKADSLGTKEFQKTPYEYISEAGNGLMNINLLIKNHSLKSSAYSTLTAKRRPKAENQSFSDVRVIKLASGKGGDGSVSFFRDSGRAIGPPDGGDGGQGGSIYVQAVEGLTSLNKLKQTYKAGDGNHGQQRQLDGSSGKDVLISVPVGTIIKWVPDPLILKEMFVENEEYTKYPVVARGENIDDYDPHFIQLSRNGFQAGEGWIFKDKEYNAEWHADKEFFKSLNQKVSVYDTKIINEEKMDDLWPLHGVDLSVSSGSPQLLLKGGAGGLGNMHFLTNEVRNPRFCKRGRARIEGHFVFELKLLADLGLVGLPNAGKSSLLRAISNARPRVGHWEFTTLQPTIGTISLGLDKPSFTVADIPGLIKGASQNKGMGIDFLRHVERSGGLVFVVSLGNPDPVADFKILLGEMGKRTENKKILVAATKADLEGSEERFLRLKEFVDMNGWKIIPISALNNENIESLIMLMGECAGKV
ncbi:hypothetical protein WICPIJ_009449 [Wickerhamomyces pijperi]|uniref:GTPase MTG2, mitochondrial n=1 Tax=Wickerhamomyces pijperi TaxID=599730 RepID=A0A9P8PPC5_WICPI|nr:hypothetical protein WICPIJ_009449 [Wickerhamomyces pijperi]